MYISERKSGSCKPDIPVEGLFFVPANTGHKECGILVGKE
ncbi:hypothetical protein HS9_03962 [Bacillus velezensis]|nr:hypothetical protein HS9_03962 [Bacillus velezensis]